MTKLKDLAIGATVLFLGTAKEFSGENATEDMNGKMPTLIEPFAGTSPRGVNLVSGTVAEQQGFVKGQIHFCKATYMGKAISDRSGEEVDSFNISLVKANVDPFDEGLLKWQDNHPLEVIIPMENPQGGGAGTRAENAQKKEIKTGA